MDYMNLYKIMLFNRKLNKPSLKPTNFSFKNEVTCRHCDFIKVKCGIYFCKIEECQIKRITVCPKNKWE